jgi:hypothetical protein
MRRLTIHLCVAIITFGVGLLTWFLNPLRGEIREIKYSHHCRKEVWRFNRLENGLVHAGLGGVRQDMTPACPLLVKVSRNEQSADTTVGFEFYSIEITNLTKKTVRSYSLGFTCDTCRPGVGSPSCWCSIPVLNVRIHPGEFETTVLPAGEFHDSERRVWVDWVDFEDGSNWKLNQTPREDDVKGK